MHFDVKVRKQQPARTIDTSPSSTPIYLPAPLLAPCPFPLLSCSPLVWRSKKKKKEKKKQADGRIVPRIMIMFKLAYLTTHTHIHTERRNASDTPLRGRVTNREVSRGLLPLSRVLLNSPVLLPRSRALFHSLTLSTPFLRRGRLCILLCLATGTLLLYSNSFLSTQISL